MQPFDSSYCLNLDFRFLEVFSDIGLGKIQVLSEGDEGKGRWGAKGETGFHEFCSTQVVSQAAIIAIEVARANQAPAILNEVSRNQVAAGNPLPIFHLPLMDCTSTEPYRKLRSPPKQRIKEPIDQETAGFRSKSALMLSTG